MADFLFAVGVIPRRIKEAYPCIVSFPKQSPGRLHGYPLHRKGAKTVLIDDNPCSAERHRSPGHLFIRIQHILKRFIAVIDPDVLFLCVKAQIFCKRSFIIGIIPPGNKPVYFLKFNLA